MVKYNPNILKQLSNQRVFHCNGCGKETIVDKTKVGDVHSVKCIYCGRELTFNNACVTLKPKV